MTEYKRPENNQPSPFKEKVNAYLKNFAQALGMKDILAEHQQKIVRIIDRNNQIADLIESDGPDGYKSIVKEEIALRGEAKLGFVYCIDGRIPTIFLAGRFANAWEEPAGLIGLTDSDNGAKTPRSTILEEALDEAAAENRDVLEVFFAHTSTINGPNTCGYMDALASGGKLPAGVTDLTAENIRQFEQDQIPAVTEYYNRVRMQRGQEPLARVGISAVYETDTMGVVLNYGQGDKQFSTTDMVNSIRTGLESIVGEHLGSFGSMRETFAHPENFTTLSQRVLELTKFLMSRKNFAEHIDGYLSNNYADMTDSQRQALRFMIFRTMALQYVTGLAEPGQKHEFTHHNEDYLAVSLSGKTVGRFDTSEQVFASTPSDTPTAIADIILKLFLMDKHDAVKPYILFVSNPVKKADFDKFEQSGSESVRRNMALNASLYRTAVNDAELKQRIKQGDLIVVPVLVDQNTGKILEVPDHTAKL